MNEWPTDEEVKQWAKDAHSLAQGAYMVAVHELICHTTTLAREVIRLRKELAKTEAQP